MTVNVNGFEMGESGAEGPCFVCKNPTRWISVDYESFFCASVKCVTMVTEDLLNLTRKLCDKEPDAGEGI